MGGQSSNKWTTGNLKKQRNQREEGRKSPKTGKTGRIFVTICLSQEIYTHIDIDTKKKIGQ